MYQSSAPLFFKAAQKTMSALETVDGHTKAVILITDEVQAMDVTGMVVLESALS